MLGWLPCPLVVSVLRGVECSSHTLDPVHGTLLTLPVTGMLDVFVTNKESVRSEITPDQRFLKQAFVLIKP